MLVVGMGGEVIFKIDVSCGELGGRGSRHGVDFLLRFLARVF